MRHLIALEAANLMARLEAHSGEMIGLFSLHRDRQPLLAPLRSSLSTIGFRELSLLEPRQQSALGAFVEQLEALRWYFTYTADMPGAAEQRFRRFRLGLEAAFERLRAVLGSPEP